MAMRLEARRRIPVAGRGIGNALVGLERKALQRSSAVVAISEDFRKTLLAWGVPAERMHVIENWAPVDELPVRPRENGWASRHGLDGKPVLLYSGTLGLKHDAGLAARSWRTRSPRPGSWSPRRGSAPTGSPSGRARTCCCSDSSPTTSCRTCSAPATSCSSSSSAPRGAFAVPSKVLSYLCAGRPLLASLPADNLAARVVESSGGGLLVEPDDAGGLVEGARRLLADDELRARLGADRACLRGADVRHRPIADRFEDVLASVVSA